MKTDTPTHTPGPWYPVTLDASPDHAWAIDSELVEIARLSEWPDNQTEAEANARLIAAAPDLLAALESLAVGLSPASVEIQRENLADLCRVCREIAESAISKAKGGLHD
jgi:hypothetical protein